MPRTNIDYSKTIIYKIVCKDLNIIDLYVGSTTDFKRRKCEHKRRCNPENKKSHYKVYQMMRNNGGWDNWDMLEVEKYPCDDGNESRTRERYWLENLEATLNKVIPSRTKLEYRKDNIESIKKRDRNHYYNNIEEKTLYGKEYYEKNKELKQLKQRQYFENNKEAILQKEKENIFICCCGSEIRKSDKAKHLRTTKHLKYVDQDININI